MLKYRSGFLGRDFNQISRCSGLDDPHWRRETVILACKCYSVSYFFCYISFQHKIVLVNVCFFLIFELSGCHICHTLQLLNIDCGGISSYDLFN